MKTKMKNMRDTLKNKMISKKRKTRNNYSKKHKELNKVYSCENIVFTFLKMLNSVKLFHWNTKIYSRHKSSDELYENLNKNIDTFIEIMLGKTGERLNIKKDIVIPSTELLNKTNFLNEIKKYENFLINMSNDHELKKPENSDILSVRDELLVNLRQFLYLLTFV